MVSGIISSGFGLGSFVFSWIGVFIINPHNEKYDADKRYSAEIADNLPKALKILSIIYLIISLIGAALIFKPTDTEEEIIKERAR